MKTILFIALLGTSAMGAMAPNFRGAFMDGKKTSLQENLKPGKALLLSFWATWCVPCLEELSMLKKELATEKDLPLNVLTVNVDNGETSTDLKAAVKLHGVSFPVVADPANEIFAKYQVEKSLPFSVLIGPDGQIWESFHGLSESMVPVLKKKLATEFRLASKG